MAKSFDELANRTMSKSDRNKASRRAFEILTELFLREIRQAVGLSQSELAARLGIRQPSLSKLESQEQDMQIETLRRIVEALGGQLDVIARFPKGTVRLAEFSEEAPRHRPSRQQLRELELV